MVIIQDHLIYIQITHMPLTNPFDFDFVIHPYIVSVMQKALFYLALIYLNIRTNSVD